MWSPYVSNYNNPIRYSDPKGGEGQECCERLKELWGNEIRGVQIAYRWVEGKVKQVLENAKDNWNARRTIFHQAIDNPLSMVTGRAEIGLVADVLGVELITSRAVVSTKLGAFRAELNATVNTELKTVAAEVNTSAKAVEKYEVGTASDLYKKSVKGDGIDIHHVSQGKPANQLIPGYEKSTAPEIALPEAEHNAIPVFRGTTVAGNARQQLAKDIRDLRTHTQAPNSSLQKLIDLNKKLYPNSFIK